MANALKVYTTGTTIVPIALARMVGNTHHVGQAEVYVSATTKAAAYAALKLAGLAPSSPSHAGFRQAHPTATTVAALVEAELFTTPTILITRNGGIGPVAQVTDDRGAVIAGDLRAADRGTTIVGQRRIAEHRTRFVPAGQN